MQLMSIEDLAVYLGDSKRTIYKYIATGDCPPYIKISAKNIKFDRADVDAWLESKKMPASAALCITEEPLPWAPRALRVTQLAEQEAKQRGCAHVGTEHLLVAVMQVPECIAAIILKNLNVSDDRLRRLYEATCGPLPAGDRGTELFLETARMAIRCAIDEARRCGHIYLGTEHLLPGILLVSGSVGGQILAELGVDLHKVRKERDKLVVCRSTERRQPGSENNS